MPAYSYPSVGASAGARQFSITTDTTLAAADFAGAWAVFILVDSSGTESGLTVTIPQPAAVGAPLTLYIVDVGGAAQSKPIALDMTGGGTVIANGSFSFPITAINSNYGRAGFVFPESGSTIFFLAI